jgi:acetyltransferase-like isoleucine patch superfamily enzyme
MNLLKSISREIISYYHFLKLKQIGSSCHIHPSVNLSGYTKNISIGNNVLICPHSTIRCDSRDSFIKIGNNTVINDYCMLLTYGGYIKIGEFCNINPFSILYGHGGLTIGNNVLIAAQTVMIPANHGFLRRDIPIMSQPHTLEGIAIEDDVWIGTGVKILDGCTVGTGTIIGAGTVLTKSVPPYSIVAGVPGKVIRERDK